MSTTTDTPNTPSDTPIYDATLAETGVDVAGIEARPPWTQEEAEKRLGLSGTKKEPWPIVDLTQPETK